MTVEVRTTLLDSPFLQTTRTQTQENRQPEQLEGSFLLLAMATKSITLLIAVTTVVISTSPNDHKSSGFKVKIVSEREIAGKRSLDGERRIAGEETEDESGPNNYKELYEKTEDVLNDILDILDEMEETVEDGTDPSVDERSQLRNPNAFRTDRERQFLPEISFELEEDIMGGKKGLGNDFDLLSFLPQCKVVEFIINGTTSAPIEEVVFCFQLTNTLNSIIRYSTDTANGIFTNRNLIGLQDSYEELQDQNDELEDNLEQFQVDLLLQQIVEAEEIVDEAISVTENRIGDLEKNEKDSVVFTSVFTTLMGLIAIGMIAVGIFSFYSFRKKTKAKLREIEKEHLIPKPDQRGKYPPSSELYYDHERRPTNRTYPTRHSTNGSRLLQDSLARGVNTPSHKYGYNPY